MVASAPESKKSPVLGLAWLVFLQGAGYALTLIWNVVVARRVDVATYGDLTFAMTLVALAGLVLGLGQQQAIVRHRSAARAGTVPAAARAGIVAIARSGLATAVLGGTLLLTVGPSVRGIPVVALCAAGLASAILGIAGGVFQARRRTALAVLANPLGVALGLAVAFLITTGDAVVDWQDLVRAITWGHGVPAGAFALTILALGLGERGRGATQATPLFRFGLKSMQISLVYLGITHLDRVMMGFLSTSEQLGVYGVGARFATLLFLVVYVFPPLVGPVYAQDDADGPKKAVYEASTYLVTLVVLPLGLLMLLAPALLVRVTVGPAYAEAEILLRVLAGSAFLVAATGNNGLLLLMGGRENIESALSFGTLVVNAVLNLWLIPLYGGLGAAAATAASLLASTICKSVVCWREWRVRPALLVTPRLWVGGAAMAIVWSGGRAAGLAEGWALAAALVAYGTTVSYGAIRTAAATLAARGGV